MEKLKNIFDIIKKGLAAHKRICMTALLIVVAVAVAGVSVAFIGKSHASSDIAVGGETTKEAKEPIIMYHSTDIDDLYGDDEIELIAQEEPSAEEEVVEEESGMEFEYDGRVINISADAPVELIPEEELEKKVEEDPGDTVIGENVAVEDPGEGQVKDTVVKPSASADNNQSNNQSNNQGNQNKKVEKNVYSGDAFKPFSSDYINEISDGYTMPSSFSVTNSSGTVVKNYTASQLAEYGQDINNLSMSLDTADTYTLHYEFESPTVQVDKAIPGIDVSHWQNDIDWSAVAAAGYKYAMIKVAGRSIADEGNLYEDNYFRDNINGALSNGLQVGVYFFSQALTVQEAYEEASYILNLIKGYNISYPVAFDWETSAGYRTCDKLSRSELTEICEAFCDTVKSHGYKPMIYMSKSDWINRVDTNRLASKYNVWLAWYFYKYYNSDDNRLYQDGDEVPDLSFKYNIWQYTSTGKVPGISGNCDMNVTFTKDFVNGDKITKDITLNVTKKPEPTTQPPKPTTQPSETGSTTAKPSETESTTTQKTTEGESTTATESGSETQKTTAQVTADSKEIK